MREHQRSTHRVLAIAAAVLAVATLTFLLSPEDASARQEGQYAGIDQCAACHEETVAGFKDSIHGKKGFEMRTTHSCESCHGPGQAHVDAGGGEGTMATLGSMSKADQSEMCLTCHDRGSQMDWHGSSHDARGMSCQDCHAVHNPEVGEAQLKAPESDLCFTCHKQKRSQFYRASHHPIREGKMDCSDCHNPHSVQNGKLVDQAVVTESCYVCHAEKRGPFLWQHVTVREDCSICHEPHGSNHMKLLKVKQPFLCQRCHSDTRHPGTLYDQNQLNNVSNRLFSRSCTNCHSMVHGSNHPSGWTFLR